MNLPLKPRKAQQPSNLPMVLKAYRTDRKFKTVLILLLLQMLAGCSNRQPSLTLTVIPVAAAGGPDNVATFEGDVHNLQAGQRLVLYSKAGPWFLQPDADHSSIEVAPGGHWKTEVHLGSEYTAIVTDHRFTPPPTMAALPPIGNGVIAIANATGRADGPFHATLPVPRLRFSGYDWLVRVVPNVRLGPHSYSESNLSLDGRGFLHFRITKEKSGWVCSEVKLGRSLGYGTYSFTVEDSAHVEPATVLQLYTWSDAGLAYNHREMNINLSRWGHAEGNNAEFIVQPFFVKTNSYRFPVSPGLHTYSFRWEPESVLFRSVNGSGDARSEKPIAVHTFVGSIPRPGDEATTMTFCEFGMSDVPMKHEAEIVVERFQYLP